jgi:hypothetical protein
MDLSTRSVRDSCHRGEGRDYYLEEKKRCDSYNEAIHADSNGVKNGDGSPANRPDAKKHFVSLVESPASLSSRLYQRATWICCRVRRRRFKARTQSRSSAYSTTFLVVAFFLTFLALMIFSILLLYFISTQLLGLHISVVSTRETAEDIPSEPKESHPVGVEGVVEHSHAVQEDFRPAPAGETGHHGNSKRESGPGEAKKFSWSTLEDKLKEEPNPTLRLHTLRTAFAQARKQLLQVENEGKRLRSNKLPRLGKLVKRVLDAWLQEIDTQIRENKSGSVRWLPSYLLPPIQDTAKDANQGADSRNNHQVEDDGESVHDERQDEDDAVGNVREPELHHKSPPEFFKASRSMDFDTYYSNIQQGHGGKDTKQANARNHRERRDETADYDQDDPVPSWMKDWAEIQARGQSTAPAIDYTSHTLYQYPMFRASPTDPDHYTELPNFASERALLSTSFRDMEEPPSYPLLRPFETIYDRWPQDGDVPVPGHVQVTPSAGGKQEFSSPVIVETLQHFDFQNEEQMKAAVLYRDSEVPFKIYNIPEIQNVTNRWTDEYLAAHFLDPVSRFRLKEAGVGSIAKYLLDAGRATSEHDQKRDHLASGRAQESIE